MMIFGIILIITGLATIIFIVGILPLILGIIPLIFGIVDLIIWSNLKTINEMIDKGDYGEAKSKQLVWMVLGFILGGFLPGILLLIGYLKYDELIRRAGAPA